MVKIIKSNHFSLKINFIYIIFSLKLLLTNAIPDESQTLPQLKYFEVIDKNEIKHNIVKRSAAFAQNTNQLSDENTESVELSFGAIDRNFNLLLTNNKDILWSQFKAFTVDSNGNKKLIPINTENFYSGAVDGIDGSDVRALIDDNGLLTASINTGKDIYEIEPIWRHLPQNQYNNSSMIVYKQSDIIHSSDSYHNKSSKFCDFIKINENTTDDDYERRQRIRRKRESLFDSEPVIYGDIDEEFTPTATHCAVVLVADYLFYQTMGNSDEKTTINYLIHIIDRVNNIFNNTEWKDEESNRGFKGMGFWIKEILIHNEPTDQYGHYNSRSTHWPVRDLLESFSQTDYNSQFCLAHLFTHQTFDKSVLGLAYVASPRSSSIGGICSLSYQKGGKTLYLNTGLTTTQNNFGHRIITREAVLVTAHEFGHNWGSEHDPHTQECSPQAKKGGSYVMYTYSVSGYDENNRLFSPCSKRSIRAVLVAKSSKCFSKPDRAYCGNSKLEPGEECDEGLLTKEYSQGVCCDSRCRLMPGSYCSDKNSPCCASCQVKRLGEVCRDKNQNNCKKESYCDGESDQCKEPDPLPDGTQCLDRGKCRKGKCITYCQSIGQFSCMCDTDADACYRCCRFSSNASNAVCLPTHPKEPLPDGTPCKHGFCENQRCEKAVQDFVERFWDVIEEIDINTFLRFMKDNIVGFVIVISLIIWIPIGCAIRYYDDNKKKELKREIYQRSLSNGSNTSRFRPNRRTFSTRYNRPSTHGYDENQIVYYPSTYQT